MESYDDATYLWGASVTVNQPTKGVEGGYRAFVEWGELTREAEASIFQDFWTWLSAIREACRTQGRTFIAYCFWAAAEDGAMNRAVANPRIDGPRIEDLLAFRRADPPPGLICTRWPSAKFRPKDPLDSSNWRSRRDFAGETRTPVAKPPWSGTRRRVVTIRPRPSRLASALSLTTKMTVVPQKRSATGSMGRRRTSLTATTFCEVWPDH